MRGDPELPFAKRRSIVVASFVRRQLRLALIAKAEQSGAPHSSAPLTSPSRPTALRCSHSQCPSRSVRCHSVPNLSLRMTQLKPSPTESQRLQSNHCNSDSLRNPTFASDADTQCKGQRRQNTAFTIALNTPPQKLRLHIWQRNTEQSSLLRTSSESLGIKHIWLYIPTLRDL